MSFIAFFAKEFYYTDVMNTKRLFLVAGYDAGGNINSALIHQVRELANYGDIILYMDCDTPETELSKIKQYCIYAGGARHGEYDFGSYKRAYEYARDNDILRKYDYIYLVNDSVFGPLFDMSNIMQKIDSVPADAAGMVVSTHKTHSYMESWFIRLNKKIFTSNWFNEFISGVTKQPTKNRVTVKYEHGLSDLIHQHGLSWGGVYTRHGRYTYNKPKQLFKDGCPFVKKSCFTRHNGSLGGEIKYIIQHADNNAANNIITAANLIYGHDYIQRFLTYNPTKILGRRLDYALTKIKNRKK